MSPNEELSSQLTELHLHISEFLQNLESEKAEESDVIVPAEKTNTSIGQHGYVSCFFLLESFPERFESC